MAFDLFWYTQYTQYIQQVRRLVVATILSNCSDALVHERAFQVIKRVLVMCILGVAQCHMLALSLHKLDANSQLSTTTNVRTQLLVLCAFFARLFVLTYMLLLMSFALVVLLPHSTTTS
jgi:hypothetical protein